MFKFFKNRQQSTEHPAFESMPVKMVTAGAGRMQLAVHVSGHPGNGLPALVCLGGYTRNMLDYADFIRGFQRLDGSDRGLAAVDLPGRGRSTYQPLNTDYSTLRDADAAIEVMTALGAGPCIIVGQGHGGQVAMLVARKRPALLAAAVLVDAGPVTDPRGIVRVRNNFKYIAALKSRRAASEASRKIVAADYPGESEARLDELVGRQYRIDSRGRMQPLFDTRLITQLEQFDFDDVLEPQWSLFDALAPFPLMLVRTQLSDQLRRETFDEMARRRPDASKLVISGAGSPALLDGPEEIKAILDFCNEAGISGRLAEDAA